MRHFIRAILFAVALAFGLPFTSVGPGQLVSVAQTAPALLDINSASQKELEALKGIGPVRAAAIINGRPYQRKDQLVSRGIISQGVYRTGADVLQAEGLRGTGVKIAVLDLGFGTRWRSKLGTELPPATGIDAVQSFDRTTGQPEIVGLSSSDTPTSHGESVAEVVHDMAPDATLTLVNYHTELEFEMRYRQCNGTRPLKRKHAEAGKNTMVSV